MKIKTGIFFLLILSFLASDRSFAGKKNLPGNLDKGLTYLLDLSDRKDDYSFKPENVLDIVNFVLNDKKDGLYYSKLKTKKTSAFCGYTINAPLKKLIDYVFNPVIPSSAMAPTSVRISYWNPLDPKKSLSMLTENFDTFKEPVVVKGVEHTETTPNRGTGGYYIYDLDNTCILFELNGRKILISLNKQIKKSTVGHKGYPYGNKKDPYYLYTHDDGLTSFGLGWVDSYVYDSMSISVYVSDGAKMKCGAFNWINAGWAKNNMAKRKHVYKGIEKYGKDIKNMLENKNLPSVEQLKKACLNLKKIDSVKLLKITKDFYRKAEKKFGNFPDDEYEDEVKMEKYTREQLEAVVLDEFIRISLGKDSVFGKKDIPFMFQVL